MFKRLQQFVIGTAGAAALVAFSLSMVSESILDSTLFTHAYAQAATIIQSGTTWFGHFNIAQRIAPTVTNATILKGSTDFAGGFSAPTTGSAVLTFNVPFLVAPICLVSRGSQSTGLTHTETTTAITFSGLTIGADTIRYACFGNQ
jgi:hypothetical protein